VRRPGGAVAALTAAAVAAFSAAAIVYGAAAPVYVETGCLFAFLSGAPCPLCGATRALGALVHGDISAALRYNAAAAVLFPAMLIGGLAALALPKRRERILRKLYVFAGAAGWLWLVYWLARVAAALLEDGRWTA